jgi:hypothetical protein
MDGKVNPSVAGTVAPDSLLGSRDWNTWYAPGGIASLTMLIAIAVWAFGRSLGSRELLGDDG